MEDETRFAPRRIHWLFEPGLGVRRDSGAVSGAGRRIGNHYCAKPREFRTVLAYQKLTNWQRHLAREV